MDGIHEGETDGAILARMGTDATAWAREMSQTAGVVAHAEVTKPGGPSTYAQALSALLLDGKPGAWLHGWLCNAIEAGRATGYSQGRRDAQERAVCLAREADVYGYNDRGDAVRGALALVVDGIGWPLPGLPANLAGRTQPEDPAGRGLPANLAGRDDDPFGWEKAAIAGLRASATVDPPEERSPIARTADALEGILETLRAVVRPETPGVQYPAVRVVRS